MGRAWNRWRRYNELAERFTRVYVCAGCGRFRPWCDGGPDSELCDSCWALTNGRVPWAHGCGDCSEATISQHTRWFVMELAEETQWD